MGETRLEMAAFDLMTGTSLTHGIVDRERAVLALRAASRVTYPAVLRMILDKRAAWRTYLTVTQRRWQRETRRPSRARHPDSISIREGYVRCR